MKLSRVIHFANAPARAELVPEQSVLVADGIAKPVIAVRLLDRDGRPVRAGITGSVHDRTALRAEECNRPAAAAPARGSGSLPAHVSRRGRRWHRLHRASAHHREWPGGARLRVPIRSRARAQRAARAAAHLARSHPARLGDGRLRRGIARLRDAVREHGGARRDRTRGRRRGHDGRPDELLHEGASDREVALDRRLRVGSPRADAGPRRRDARRR